MPSTVDCVNSFGRIVTVKVEDLIIRPSAYGFVRDTGDRILVVAQRDGLGSGDLILPGGRLERGETAASCVERETLEETGCRVEAHSFACLAEAYFGCDIMNEPYQMVALFYHCAPLDRPGDRHDIFETEEGQAMWLTVAAAKERGFVKPLHADVTAGRLHPPPPPPFANFGR